MIYYTDYLSPYGKMLLASDGTSLIGLWFYKQKYFKSNIKEEFILNDNLAIFKKTKKWLDDYFNGLNPSINSLKLKPIGTKFRQDVYNLLCKIPYGKTTTYASISKEIAKIYRIDKMSAQAIGGAVSHNPISIIIPCHRVIGSNGSLTGYAGGLAIKEALLKYENEN